MLFPVGSLCSLLKYRSTAIPVRNLTWLLKWSMFACSSSLQSLKRYPPISLIALPPSVIAQPLPLSNHQTWKQGANISFDDLWISSFSALSPITISWSEASSSASIWSNFRCFLSRLVSAILPHCSTITPNISKHTLYQ